MAFTVEDGTGTVSGANSYASVAEFDSYWTDRGKASADPGVASTTAEKEQWLIQATDYVDRVFGECFRGQRLLSTQPLKFPRGYLYDDRGILIEGIPDRLKDAVIEYAVRQGSSELLPDPTTVVGGSISKAKVGPLEIEISETESRSDVKAYPAADALLALYTRPRGVIV